MHDFRLYSRQADNQLAGKSSSQMQILGYRDKLRPEYVIICNSVPLFDVVHLDSFIGDYGSL